MSMVPIQSSLPIVSSEPNDFALDRVGNLLTVLSLSESSVVDEGKKTASKFERFVAAMQKQFISLAEENQALQKQLVTAESQLREISLTSQAQVLAAEQKEETAQREIQALGQEIIETTQRAKAHIAAQTAAKIEAVQNITSAIEARVADARQREEIAHKETETLRQEIALQEATALAACTAQIRIDRQMEDTLLLVTCSSDLAFVRAEASTYAPWVASFNQFVIEILHRPAAWSTNATQEGADTQKLQQLASELSLLLTASVPIIHNRQAQSIISICELVHSFMFSIIVSRKLR